MDATYNNYSYLESGSFFIISSGFHDMVSNSRVTTFQNQDLASHNAGIKISLKSIKPKRHFKQHLSEKVIREYVGKLEDHSGCRDAMNASAWAMATSMSRTSLSTFV